MNSYKLLTGKVRFLVKRRFNIAFLNAIRKGTLGERERSDGNGEAPFILTAHAPPLCLQNLRYCFHPGSLFRSP